MKNINTTTSTINNTCDCDCDKSAYRCAICGKSYDTIEERSACETKCLSDRAEAERKRKEEELRKTKENRKKELDMAWDHYNELLKAYIKDYGSYSAVREYSNGDWVNDLSGNINLTDSIDRLFRW